MNNTTTDEILISLSATAKKDETTRELIKRLGVTTFYAVEIGNWKYSVYFVNPANDRGMDCLWPTHDDKGKPESLPVGMIRSKSDKLPRYHFHFPGYGFSRHSELIDSLALWLEIDKNRKNRVRIYKLDGWYPSTGF